MFIYKNVPNILTTIRIIIIPTIIFSFYFGDSAINRQISGLLFLIAIITDFLDGYVARKYNSESNLGRILDPMADKILVSSVFLILVKFNIANEIAVILIIAREFLISGIREFMSQYNFELPVSKISKIKTFVQMTAVFVLLVGNKGSGLMFFDELGSLLLWIAVFLTIFSGLGYIRVTLNYLKKLDNN